MVNGWYGGKPPQILVDTCNWVFLDVGDMARMHADPNKVGIQVSGGRSLGV